MSRTLLILALVALLFAGVMAQDSSSSSSTGDASSTIDSSSTAVASSTAVSSSTAVASSTAASSSAASTGSSSSSSAGAASSSSSTGSNSSIVSSSSSSSSTGGSAAANVTLIVNLVADAAFNTSVQNILAPVIASALGIDINASPATWSTDNSARRRLLAVSNAVAFSNVLPSVANAAVTSINTPGSVALQSISQAATAQGATGLSVSATSVPENNENAASGLAASPLLLAAAAVFAMLF